MHLLRTEWYEAIVPDYLPAHRALVYISALSVWRGTPSDAMSVSCGRSYIVPSASAVMAGIATGRGLVRRLIGVVAGATNRPSGIQQVISFGR